MMKPGNSGAATNRLATTLSILLLASGLGAGVASGQGVVINEFMADNTETITNKLGKTSDWIELYNGTGAATNLAGWYLTDDAAKVDKWKFPSTNLAAGKYLLVYASESNGVYFGELHTGFKLSKNAGGYLALADSNKVVVSSYTNYPDQDADVSYGIATNVPGGLGYFTRSSPGAANSNGLVAFVADTKFSVNRGLFTTNITVAVTSATAEAQIHYTTDCSDPTTNSALYTDPRSITNTTVLRANAFKSGWVPSGIDTHSYILLADVLNQPTNPPGWPAIWTVTGSRGTTNVTADYHMDPRIVTGSETAVRFALTNLPTLSLVTPQTNLFDPATGIYANPTQSGELWERPVSAEWIDPDNKSKFQIDCGFRIQGGAVRGEPESRKRGFTLRFRDSYGENELVADLFSGDAVGSFRELTLRDGADDSWPSPFGNANSTYIKDEFARRMQLAMGHVSPHGRFVHLYLNGLYWGIYNVTEKIDDNFAASYYGGDADDWDVMSSYQSLLDGSSAAWQAMKTVLTDNTLSPDAKFQKVQGNNPDGTRNPAFPVYLDVNNYIDYILVGKWMATADWGANWRACRYRDDVESTGFKFPNWDSTDGMDTVDAWGHILDGGGGFDIPHVNLKNSVEYRLRFADRVQKHFFHGGALTATNLVARWRELKAELDQAMVAESARWGDFYKPDPSVIYTVQYWRNQVNYLETYYVAQRSAFILGGAGNAWSFKALGLYPTNVVSPSFTPVVSVFTNSMTLTISSSSPVYYTLDGRDPREYGTGAIIGTLYSSPLVLTDTTIVKARARSAGGEWSALSEMVFTAATKPSLRVSELMYHPREPEAGQSWKNEGDEFIELYNAGATPICMVGMKLTQGVRFDFASGAVPILQPGGYLLVVRNRIAFTNRYPSVAVNQIAGQFDGRANSLDNGGEKIELQDAVGRNVITFTYNNAWLPQTDGAGHSLIPLSGVPQADGELNYPGNWKASVYIGGSPGAAEPAAPDSSLVLNEIVAHTDTNGFDSNDGIELYNTTGSQIVLGAGWYLSDDPADLKKWAIPATNTVAAQGWRYFDEIHDFHNPTTNGFGLDKAGEQVLLSYLPGTSQDRVVDAVFFRAQENEASLGRYGDGGAMWFDCVPTLGASNRLSAAGVVIGEVMYHPATNVNYPVDNGDCEYVELYNPTAQAIGLTNVVHDIGGVWRLAGGIEYPFPSNTVLAAGGRLVVVSFDPLTNSVARASFLAYYGLTIGQITLLGPYSRQLDNQSDTVRLVRPVFGDPPGPIDDISWHVIDQVTYYDLSPWPAADGFGYSLDRVTGQNSGDDAASWEARTPTPGTSSGQAPTTYPVTYNANGGSGSVPANQTKTHDVSLSLASNSGNLTKPGYTFAGWNTAADGNGTDYAVGTNYTANAALTLYAKWTQGAPTTYTVAYNANGGTGAAPATQTKTQDVAVVVSDKGNLAKTGYTFDGWNTAAAGNGTGYAVGANYTANASITLYAQWSPIAQAPAITADPTNATVMAGLSATFNVTATGTTPLSYEWYKNSAVLGGAAASSYTTPATTTNDNGSQFKVTVSNAYGVATSTVAMLTVNAAPIGGVYATGGTIMNYTQNGTNWTAHIFTSSGPLTVMSGGAVEYLVVGGGGGGGVGAANWGGGGGGGAGGMLEGSATVAAQAYDITVGSGGNSQQSGDNSTFNSITAVGGGKGADWGAIGWSGGSGGGGGGGNRAGGLGTLGQGTNGGVGSTSGAYDGAGGGGGKGAVGGSASGGTAGNGGAGTISAITGASVAYAGGGGGGGQSAGGTGGSGIGGNGGRSGSQNGADGAINTGSGGGGAGGSSGLGGKGGSGIVIVRYVSGGADPRADSDGDGMSNADEAIAGTDPHSATSRLVLYASTNSPVADGKFVLSWQSVTGRTYTVMATTSPMSAFTNLFPTNIAATPSVNVYTDILENAVYRFYRVKVE